MSQIFEKSNFELVPTVGRYLRKAALNHRRIQMTLLSVLFKFQISYVEVSRFYCYLFL